MPFVEKIDYRHHVHSRDVAFKSIHVVAQGDHYMSLKGRKQKKYADRFDAELYRYSATENELKKAFPRKIPTVEQLEKHIAKLRGKQENMNTKYDVLDQKSRELSEAAREIEDYLSQEQKRDRQKKKNRSVLE